MYYIKPAQGFLTSLFSNSRKNPVLGVIRPHQGIDIGNDSNNTIVAAASGKVRVADNAGRTGFGKYVVITHPNGQETVYAHLSKIDVKTTQVVTQGQKIGIKGTTGSSTGIHLHFEVCKSRYSNDFNNKLDPLTLFIDPLAKEIQEMLNKLGFKLAIDGIYGSSTISAISQYQKENKLGIDGVCGRTTYTHIKNAIASKPSTPQKPVAPPKSPATIPNNTQPKESIRLFSPSSITLKQAVEKEFTQAVKDKLIDNKWLVQLQQGKLSLDDAFALRVIIEQRKK